jgi:hypothetical protein
MKFPRWAALRVLFASWLALMLYVSTASAQFFVPALRTLDLDTGQLARSARLLGMGGLTLVVPDHNLTYSLWDFARIPVGLIDDDTTSTVDLDPGSDAVSSVRTLSDGRERQNLAARRTGSLVEAVYRSRESGGGFGYVGCATTSPSPPDRSCARASCARPAPRSSPVSCRASSIAGSSGGSTSASSTRRSTGSTARS